MGYRFQHGEKAKDGLKRIVGEQAAKAGHDLLNPDVDAAAFSARKRFKKIRAVIHLAKPGIASGTSKNHRERWAELGRRLSELRDTRAMRDALSRLIEHYGQQLGENACIDAIAELEQRHAAMVDWADENHVLFEGMAEEVGEAASQFETVKFESSGFDAIRGGLKKSYRQSLQRFTDAYRSDDAEAFHEWRKPLKRLWLQLRLFDPVWDEGLKDFALCVKALSDLTGEDHNLAVLREAVLGEPAAFGGTASVEALSGLTRIRSRDLRKAAQPIAKGVFAGPSRVFVDKIETKYWKALQA